MPGYLKQATAAQSRALGPFVSDSDFKTVQTGLTIANTDIKLIVNGGASANKNSGGGTHRANGVYGVTFDATDTATVGEMEVSVVVAGALPVFDKFFVIEEVVYDALFAASAPGYLQPTVAGRTLDVSAGGEAGVDWANVGSPTTSLALTGTTIAVTQKVDVDTIKTNPVVNGGTITFPTTATLASTTNITAGTVTTATNVTTVNGLAPNVITATSIAADAITAAKIADGAIDSATFAAGAINAAAIASDAITDAKVAADVTIASVTGAVGSVTGNVGGNVVGSVASVTARVTANTDQLAGQTVTAAAGVTFPTSVASPTNITAASGVALTAAYDAAKTAATQTSADAIKAVTDKLSTTLQEDNSSPTVYQFTTIALENAPTGSAPTAADVADAVWDEARAGHVSAGTFGEGVASVQGNVTGNVAGSVGSVTGLTASDVGAIKTKTDSLTFTTANRVDSQVFGMQANTVTATAVATDAIDADALASDAVTEIQSGLSTLNASGVRSAVGLASANLDTQLTAIDDYIDTEVSAIKVVTDKLDTTLQVDNSSPTVYQFTTIAMENASGSGASAADIADAVWDEVTIDHQTAGTTGKALTSASSAGDPWTTQLEGTYTASDLLRILAGVMAGKTSISGTTVTFRDVTDASDIVTADMSGSERQTVTLAP